MDLFGLHISLSSDNNQRVPFVTIDQLQTLLQGAGLNLATVVAKSKTAYHQLTNSARDLAAQAETESTAAQGEFAQAVSAAQTVLDGKLAEAQKKQLEAQEANHTAVEIAAVLKALDVTVEQPETQPS